MVVNLGTSYSTSSALSVEVVFVENLDDPLLQVGFVRGQVLAQAAKDLLDDSWGNYYPEDYPALLDAAEAGRNASVSDVKQALSGWASLYAEAILQVEEEAGSEYKVAALTLLNLNLE